LRQGDWMLGANWDVGDFHPLKAPFDMAEATTIQKSKLATFELYNLVDDIHQDRNLADEYPARLDAMKTELIRLHDDVMGESRLKQ
jgi:arylsulfatase A